MSNLLEKASIITTPTAYSDGKLHSVKPVQALGNELVVNGDFSTDSDWNLGSGQWTISNGFAVADNANNNLHTNLPVASAVGLQHKITFTLQDVTQGYVKIGLSNINPTQFNSDGTYTLYIKSTGNRFLYFDPTGFTGKLTNVSVKEVIDADFDFQRGSAATRVNSQGLIENVQTLSGNLVQNGDFSEIGSEEIVNGDFATDSDWVYGTGWSISGGLATCNGGNENLLQSNVGNANKNYKIVFSISNYVSGSVRPAFVGQYSQSIDYNANGTYIAYISSLSDLRFVFYGSGFIGSIDNVSVKEVGQNWTLGGEVTIGDDLAHFESNTNTYSYIRQDISSLASKKYKIQVEVKNYVRGAVQVGFSGSIVNINATTNGIYTVYTSPNTSGLLFEVSREFNGGNFNFDIDNISVIEITDDTDLPRIDYTDGCGSLLLEPQSTNLVTYSENFSSSWSFVNVDKTLTQVKNPSGNLGIYEIAANSTSGSHWFEPTTWNATSGVDYTFSFFAKINGSNFVQVALSTGFSSLYQNFNLLDGTLGNGDLTSGYSSNIEPFANGWYRISVTGNTISANARFLTIPILTDIASRNPSFVGDGTLGIYVWGFQKEQLSYATSYIPTNGSTATRLADVCNNSGSSDLINSTEGVLYAEISALADDGIMREISLSNGTTSERVLIRYSSDGALILYCIEAGNTRATKSTTDYNLLEFNKIAISYKQNDFKFYVNGMRIQQDNGGNHPVGLNKLSFDGSNGSNPFYGNVKSVVVFKEALTNDELEGLTGEGYDTFNALALANNYTII